MGKIASFGVELKRLRLDAGLSLRKFSELVDYDVSNLSKVERGILPPPSSKLTVRKWLAVLGLGSESEKYHQMIDLAIATRFEIPDGVAPQDVARFLPAFYRTLRNRRADETTYNELIRLLKNS